MVDEPGAGWLGEVYGGPSAKSAAKFYHTRWGVPYARYYVLRFDFWTYKICREHNRVQGYYYWYIQYTMDTQSSDGNGITKDNNDGDAPSYINVVPAGGYR
jgi:hypothetical protein